LIEYPLEIAVFIYILYVDYLEINYMNYRHVISEKMDSKSFELYSGFVFMNGMCFGES